MGFPKSIFKTCIFSLLISFLITCSGSPPVLKVSKIPITKKGKMSTAVLALVQQQNTIVDGETLHTFPDGLVFYFIIYPLNHNITPAIKQYQNFTIDREPYWQNIPNLYNSKTIIYNERTFAENEHDAFILVKLKKNTNAYIQKTILCGPEIPPESIITYRLYFGFGETFEEFEFVFKMGDIF